MPKKNPAAVALGRRSGVNLTKKQRSERARRAIETRWSKAKSPPDAPPATWYELVALPADYEWKGTAHAANVLAEVEANPEVILRSSERAEIVARSQKKDMRNRTTLIIETNHGGRSNA